MIKSLCRMAVLLCCLELAADLLISSTAALYAQPTGAKAEKVGMDMRDGFEIFKLEHLSIYESDFIENASGVAGQKGKLSVNKQYVGLNVPTLFQQGNTAIVHSLNYQLLQFDNLEGTSGVNPASLALNRLENLAAIEYRFLTLHSFSGGRWRWWLATLHGLYSDVSEGMSAEDYRLQAAFVVGRAYTGGGVFGLGLAYSTTFSFPVLPVLELHTSKEKQFGLDLFLPFSGALIYRAVNKVDIGLAGGVEGNRFNLKSSNGPGSLALTDNLRYSTGTFGPRLKLRVIGPCYLSADAGWTFRRRLEFYNNDDKTGEIELDNSLFIRLAVSAEL